MYSRYSTVIVIFVPLLVWALTALAMTAIFPKERIFLIGLEVDQQKARDRRLSNVIWGIMVAFVVGVAATLFTDWL